MFLHNHFNLIKFSLIFFSFGFIVFIPYKANNVHYSIKKNVPYEEWQASNLEIPIFDTFVSFFFHEKKQNVIEINITDLNKIKELYKQYTIFTTTYNQNNH